MRTAIPEEDEPGVGGEMEWVVLTKREALMAQTLTNVRHAIEMLLERDYPIDWAFYLAEIKQTQDAANGAYHA